MLELYRSLLRIRRDRQLAASDVALVDLDAAVVAFDITADAGTTRVIVNLGPEDCPFPAAVDVLIASEPGTTDTVPTDNAVWLAVR